MIFMDTLPVPLVQQAFPSLSNMCVGVHHVQNFPYEANLSSLYAQELAEETEHIEVREQGGEGEGVEAAGRSDTILCNAPQEQLVPPSCHYPLKNACFSPYPLPCITSQANTHNHMGSSSALSFIKYWFSPCDQLIAPPNITSNEQQQQQQQQLLLLPSTSVEKCTYIDPILTLENSFSAAPLNGMTQSQAAPASASHALVPSPVCVPEMLNVLAAAPSPISAAHTRQIEPMQFMLASSHSTAHSLNPLGNTLTQLPLESPLQFFYSNSAPNKRYKPSSPPAAAAAQGSTTRPSLTPAAHFTRPSSPAPAAHYNGCLPSADHYSIELSYNKSSSPLEAQSRSPQSIEQFANKSSVGQLASRQLASNEHNQAGAPIASSFNLMFPSVQEPCRNHTEQLSFQSNSSSVVPKYALIDHQQASHIPYGQSFNQPFSALHFEDPIRRLGADHLTTSSSTAICELGAYTLREFDHTSSSGSTKFHCYGGEEGIANANLSSTTSPSSNASPTTLNMSSIPSQDWINPNTSSCNPLTTSSPNPNEIANPNPNPNPRRNKVSVHPQGVAARRRRHRISNKFKILQTLVPGGTKMDTASMLDEAIEYIKYLRRQIWLHQLLEVSDLINSTSLSENPPSASSQFFLPSCNPSLNVGALPSCSPPPPTTASSLWPTFNI